MATLPFKTDLGEVMETLRMIEVEHLDIRTLTLGLNLLDLAGSDAGLPERIYQRIVESAGELVPLAKKVERDLGVPIVNKRVSVTPISMVIGKGDHQLVHDVALALDQAASDIGVDYIAGFSALVHKGITRGDAMLMESLPEVIGSTKYLCGSLNLASTRAGINMDAVAATGHIVQGIAQASAKDLGLGCARFVCFANAVEDNPFIAGAFHGVGEHQAALNVGISGPGVVHYAIKRFLEQEGSKRPKDLSGISEVVKRMAFKVTRAGELIGRVVAKGLGQGVQFGVVDLSLAPTPAEGDSVADILEAMGLEQVGCPGTTAALYLLTDAIKKGGAMASSSVGGLSGAFIPVSEDQGMIRAVQSGALSLDKLEAMTSICSVGLDMVAIPGDTPADTIAAIIADQMAIGVMNNKTTAARLLPIIGGHVGDVVPLGGLLGDAVVMNVSRFSAKSFIDLGGRISAPIHALRN
jgi:uncharacterized protein